MARKSSSRKTTRSKPRRKAPSKPKGGTTVAAKHRKAPSPAQLAARKRFAEMARARAGKKSSGGGGGDGHLGARGGRGGRELPVGRDGNVYVPGTKKWEVSFGTTQSEQLDPRPLVQAGIAFLQEGFKPVVADFSAFVPPLLDEIYKNEGALRASNGQQPDGISDEAWKLWKDYGQERFFGKSLFHQMGIALLYMGVSQQQWSSLYPQMIAEARQKVGGGGAAFAGMMPGTGGGWSSPLGAPTQVTSAFRAVRPDGSRHEGVDLRAAVGTPVLAPVNAVVISVDDDDEAGQYVQLAAQLPDGSYPGTFLGVGTPGRDDSTWIITLAHLSRVDVAEGATVSQGQQIGASGATGKVTGQHLHLRVEWFADNNILNERVFVDPIALIPLDVLGGTVQQAPVVNGNVPALFEPKIPGPFSGGARPGTVVVANNSMVSIAGGNASTGIGAPGAQLDLGLVNPDIGAAVGGAVSPPSVGILDVGPPLPPQIGAPVRSF